MGPFLQWMGSDVRKESTAELAAAGLEWEQVGKAVSTAAQRWLRARAEPS